MKKSPLLQATGVKVGRRDGRHLVSALDGFTLSVEAGRFLAVRGPSGSGKTAAFSALAGLEAVDEGAIEVGGHPVGPGRRRPRPDQLGLVPREPFFLEETTVAKNVALPLIYAKVPRKDRRKRARAALEFVGQVGNSHRRPLSLSLLERQKVAFARALAPGPLALLIDEPAGGLGSAGAGELLSIIERTHQSGTTVLLFTTDQRLFGYAEEELLMTKGRIAGSRRIENRKSAVRVVLGE